jgi:hypothetical protein
MTDTTTPPRIFGRGRKPPYPVGHSRRLAIPWLHELDGSLAVPVTYPIDLTNGMTSFPMWGNGPDPTLTITDAEGAPTHGEGQPVGDCFFAGDANDEFLQGNPDALTSNSVVNTYDIYEAQSQDVPLGHEQDEGVVMSDALLWGFTHDRNGNTVAGGEGIFAAFVPVTRGTVGAAMAKYGRPILTGVNLTPCDEQNFPTWTVTASCQPDQDDGHVVLLAKLNGDIGSAAGSGGPISWQQVVAADAAWMGACPEEFWIVLTPADRDKMGAATFDALVGLLSTLAGYHGVVVSPPTPTPVTPPVVTPPTPAPVPANLTNIVSELIQMLKEWVATLQNVISELGKKE